MEDYRRSLRVGAAAIVCALVFRAGSMGLPGKLLRWLRSPEFAALSLYTETSRDVRQEPSREVFASYPPESGAPLLLPTEPEPTLPSYSGEVAVLNSAGVEADFAALLEKTLTWNLRDGEPAVLILHTHTTESYTRVDEPYTESAAWRTADEDYNMVAIGEIVKHILEENGIPVIHDRELHDYPSYNGSYTRTRKAIQDYVNKYPSIQLILDLHRDAAGEGSNQMRTLATVDGEPSAQLMLVMGTNYDSYPENLSLALKLHAQLERQCPGITRPLQLRAARFNQDLCPGSLLVEVGAAGNTHPEARRAAAQLAEAIVALAEGTAREE